MLQAKAVSPSSACLPAGVPTFEILLDRLQQNNELLPTRKRDMASSLRRIAKALDLSLSETFAHPAWLQPRISKISPAAIGMKQKTWSNLVSDCRSAIELLDRAKPRVNRRKDLTYAWRSIWEALVVSERKQLGFKLAGFVFYLNHSGVSPLEVTSEHAAEYRNALKSTALRKDPEDTYRRSVAAWNLAARDLDIWPKQRLEVPPRGKRIRVGLEELPETINSDLKAYRDGAARPDFLSESADRQRPLQPTTLKAQCNRILLFAGALVRAGVPVESLTGLAALVVPETVRIGLIWLFNQNESVPRSSDLMILETLIVIAKRHAKSPPEQIKKLQEFAERVERHVPRQRGMTEKNLERLRALRDPQILQKLLNMPEEIFKAGLARAESPSGKIAMRDGVLLALLRNHPIRRKNLVGLKMNEHIVRTQRQGAYLVIQSKDVKNKRHIEFELAPELLEMIDIYRRHAGNSDWLFPSPDGSTHLSLSYVSTRVTSLVQKQVGVDFNPHLARHLAAMIYLQNQPGHYEAVRRLLGHSSTSATLDAYASFETDGVGKAYGEFLEGARDPKRVK